LFWKKKTLLHRDITTLDVSLSLSTMTKTILCIYIALLFIKKDMNFVCWGNSRNKDIFIHAVFRPYLAGEIGRHSEGIQCLCILGL
jgi:hypothetical protein